MSNQNVGKYGRTPRPRAFSIGHVCLHGIIDVLKTFAAVVTLSISSVAALPEAHAAEPPGPPKIHDLVSGGECAEAGSAGVAAREAAASAYIPLVVGMTLSYMWKANADDYEHECLTQVSEINSRSVIAKGSCPRGPNRELLTWTRKLCWNDLAESYLYLPSFRRTDPDLFGGSLMFSLSHASLTTLKSTGKVRHRFVQIEEPGNAGVDIDAALNSDGPDTFNVVVNGEAVEAPVISASYINQRKGETIRVQVLDDVRFPLMLDYNFPVDKYRITYTKISYPTPSNVEKQLSIDKRADVYGVYFDFASAELRRESEPVLREIATIMAAHPSWHLTINGHTDNVGDAAQNLDLSRRRAESVRNALVQKFMIDSSRLSTGGFGALQPRESNDTDRGRARNRRVELTRQ